MRSIFDTVVCGADGSPEGVAAVQLAARIADPAGDLELVTVVDPSVAVHAGYLATAVGDDLTAEAIATLAEARHTAVAVRPPRTALLEGPPADSLLDELRRREATLAVVGSHSHHRAAGILLGSVATLLLHEAPCSVLVAREPARPQDWPRTIVVGVDGSPESALALAAARELAVRFGARVRAVAATEGHVDLGAARALAPELEEHPARPVDALVVASEGNDLVVVGSRGLRGLRAVGSVSERVAHQAVSSVLVVRRPAL